MKVAENRVVAWRLSLLGGFELSTVAGPVDVPLGVQRVLAYIALQGRSVTRVRVAGDLWPEAAGSRAATNLRSTLWRANRVGPLVTAGAQSLRLGCDVVVDVAELTAAATKMHAGGIAEAPFLATFDLELLPGWQEEWVTLERERLRQLELHVLDFLVADRVDHGRLGEAVDAAIRAIRLEPLRESSHRDLIRIYVASGNRTAALTHYEGFANLLHRELDLHPDPATTALVEPFLRLRAGRYRPRTPPRGGGRPGGPRPA
jgi:DNA-binding SARP family transcriptional activator